MKFAVAAVLALALAGLAHGGSILTPLGRALDEAGLTGQLTEAGVQGPQLLSPDEDFSCSGTAPVTTSCVPVTFVAAPTTFRLYVVAGTPFTGTITATLSDEQGDAASWSCAYVMWVSGAPVEPTCSSSGGGELNAGTLSLSGGASGVAAGYWEIHVDVDS
jgi:hypothetical protein